MRKRKWRALWQREKKITITIYVEKTCISLRKDREVTKNSTYGLIYLYIFA